MNTGRSHVGPLMKSNLAEEQGLQVLSRKRREVSLQYPMSRITEGGACGNRDGDTHFLCTFLHFLGVNLVLSGGKKKTHGAEETEPVWKDGGRQQEGPQVAALFQSYCCSRSGPRGLRGVAGFPTFITDV